MQIKVFGTIINFQVVDSIVQMLASNIHMLLMSFRTVTELGLPWEVKDVSPFPRDVALLWIEFTGTIAG